MLIDNEAVKTAADDCTFVSDRGKPLEEWFRELGADVPEGAFFRISVLNRDDDDRTPDHYAGCGVTASEALRSMLEAPANGDVPPMALFWWALAFKYVWRLFAKGQGARDCAKARDCLARLADEMGWGDDGA